MPDPRPTRRAVLATGACAAAALLTGCGRAVAQGAAAATTSAGAATPAPATTPAPAATPPAAWAAPVSAAESGLAATYAAVITAHPALKATLTPLQAAHTAHAKALGRSAGKAGKAAQLPASRSAALTLLVALEEKASAIAGRTALTAPPQATVLLGSIAAADASHLPVLASVQS